MQENLWRLKWELNVDRELQNVYLTGLRVNKVAVMQCLQERISWIMSDFTDIYPWFMTFVQDKLFAFKIIIETR